MNLYISDLHFGHENVIRFDERPFLDVEEMDKCLILNWNARVSPEDDVYIVGDFCFRSQHAPEWYLDQLVGHKHLIIGNHDHVLLQSPEACRMLESIDKMAHVKDGDRHIALCHYPMAEWYKSRHGTWHIYGHIHNDRGATYQFMKTVDRALNAAACINNYMPVSMEELISNNMKWRSDVEKCDSPF